MRYYSITLTIAIYHLLLLLLPKCDIVLYYNILIRMRYYTIYNTMLYSIILFHIILYYIILYYIISCYTILYLCTITIRCYCNSRLCKTTQYDAVQIPHSSILYHYYCHCYCYYYTVPHYAIPQPLRLYYPILYHYQNYVDTMPYYIMQVYTIL